MTTGTNEWAVSNVNIERGCENGCRYCYARSMAVQYGGCTAKEWTCPVINQKAVDKGYRKRNGVVMFPSSHDIHPRNLEACKTVLFKLFAAGNKVLIVSKASHLCIGILRKMIADMGWKEQVEFRFTIGSCHHDVLKFWEPNAPDYGSRYESLWRSWYEGFKTSVSAEPFLDADVGVLYKLLRCFATEGVWIGKMNQIGRRVDFSKIEGGKQNPYVQNVLRNQTDEAIRTLYEKMKDLPNVHWKDSITEVING